MAVEDTYTTGPLFGQGWKQIEEWPQAGPSRLQGATGNNTEVDAAALAEKEDEDEYEEEEEEIYVMIDLGPNADPLTLGISTEYQLIGLDTPTPFLKIGNDVFQGTPQRLIGSEIITKDTRDPQNPIKHSHPAIGHTNYRISLEPVKLVPHSMDPAHKKPKERPPLFARDAPPEPPVAATSKRGTARATSAENSGETPESPVAYTSSKPAQPASAGPSSKKKPAVATRVTPLSTRYVIPASGEISADGILRIDGQEVRMGRKPRKSKKAAAAEDEADGSAMEVDIPDAVLHQDDAGPSSVPSSNNNAVADGGQDTRPPDLQRLFMPDAPHGYTKRGVPKKTPGRRAQPKKTVVEGSASQQSGTVNQAQPTLDRSVPLATAATTATVMGESVNDTEERGNATGERVNVPDETSAMEVDDRDEGDAPVPEETGATGQATQGPSEPTAGPA
ncbi:hypothetical protein QFC21_005522 [Naganishia friedmannii]|uniref:Uncharacterized protein n=1 Tax=Naganishia friedmannii TaxID=89922 RepID=A0ACC2V8G6_9TREE|nr:hypothetical protein QFC21_005522 [Naganishia friedmannii]